MRLYRILIEKLIFFMVYTILLPRFTYIKWFHIELKCRIQPKKVSLNETIKIYQKILKLYKIVRNFSENVIWKFKKTSSFLFYAIYNIIT